MTTCAEIFEQIPERFNGAAAGDWSTTIQFLIAGEGGGTWTLTIESGACTVTDGPIEAPKAIVRTDAETWVGINTGTVNPMQAFMTGKLKGEGNVGELMKLNSLQIFKRT